MQWNIKSTLHAVFSNVFLPIGIFLLIISLWGIAYMIGPLAALIILYLFLTIASAILVALLIRSVHPYGKKATKKDI